MKMDRTDELVANRQTDKWTVKQTDGLANRQSDRNEKEILIGGKRQNVNQSGRLMGWPVQRQTDRLDPRTVVETARQKDGQFWQTDGLAKRQTDRQTIAIFIHSILAFSVIFKEPTKCKKEASKEILKRGKAEIIKTFSIQKRSKLVRLELQINSTLWPVL